MPVPDGELTYRELPATVRQVLGELASHGHQAVLVGGCVRDQLLGLPHGIWDWDAATSAAPDEVAALFPHSTWENRFGTVTIRGVPPVEVTSYRTEGAYRDARRPETVRFGVSLEADLARRDFTINAVAWLPLDLAGARGRLVDPFGGAEDLARRVLRTVGEPHARFTEDALRLIRAARFAARFGLTVDPATEAAIRELAPLAGSVSGERVRDELMRILALDPQPSRAFRLLEGLGLLEAILPELAALRGVPQAKRAPGDALDHTLAADVLGRLRASRGRTDRVVGAIRHHMYNYEEAWTDAAVRRFIRRLDGVDRTLLFALRRADNAASGVEEAGERNQADLERRIRAELDQQPALLIDRRLAIDGHDLQRELDLAPGPQIGGLLDRLTDAVMDDPTRNRRDTLLAMARDLMAER